MTEQDVIAVKEFDLEKYLGLWYEIARLPLKWEDTESTNVTAHYSLNEKGTVKVDNRCFDEEGKPTQSIAEATPVDGEPGKLTVNFLPKFIRWIPFTDGDYWVLKIDEGYTMSLVGTPDHKNLWILAREAHPDQTMVDDYLEEARRQGFDLSKLIIPVHDGKSVTDDMLEDSE